MNFVILYNMHNSINHEKIHAVGCDVDAPEAKEKLAKITNIPSLARPVICLPDLNVKTRTEGPSSFVAATHNSYIQDLTAPSLGCTMGVVKTNLTTADLNEQFYEKFFKEMQKELGPRYGFWRNIALWLGLGSRPKNKYDFSDKEFEAVIKHGADYALRKYNLPQSFITHIEYGGAVFNEEELKNLDIRKILPRSSFTNGKHDIGYGFKGNHFLEIQFIEKILDQEVADNWGLKERQVVIMYHGGGGAVPYHIGRYYAQRKKNTLKQKFFLFIAKVFFHFGSFEGIKNWRARLQYYFFPKPFQEIPADSPEGKRLELAIKAALNYSYAFDMAIIRRIIDSLKEALPGQEIKAELLWNAIHNSIHKENINGEELVVHRHTATKIFEGRPVIVSGHNNTNSYLGVGMKDAERHLFSADHGAGETIKRFEQEGLSKPHPQAYTTHIYRTKDPHKKTVHHITAEGIDFVMKHLEREGAVRPVVRLRPLAVFKG